MAEPVAPTRRHVLGASTAAVGAAALGALGTGSAYAAPVLAPATTPTGTVAPASGDITVTLLGTGSPGPNPDRYSAATLVEAGGIRLLFDAGRGCTIRLRQIGVTLGSVTATFLTHFHSDHLSGLADFWMTGYIQTAYAKRSGPMELVGPPGTRELALHMRKAFYDDIAIRMADEKVPERATRIRARDFHRDGVVFRRDGVVVRAFQVDHGPLIPYTYGYRVDYAGRSVLISGDTRYDPRIARHGEGVDLLVHEVCVAAPEVLPFLNNRAVADHHTSPEDAGRIFAKADPRLAAYTHIIQLTPKGATTEPDLAYIEKATRQAYAGPLEVGHDLMRFAVGQDIQVQRWDRAAGGYRA